MNAKMKSLAYIYCITNTAIVLLFIFASRGNAEQIHLSNVLTGPPCSRSEMSSEDASWLLQQKPSTVLRYIRKTAQQFKCKNGHLILNQHAVAYIGVFGSPKDTKIIKNIRACEESCAKELYPCEYYCAYDFADNLLAIRFKGKRAPIIDASTNWPIFNSDIMVDKITGLLSKLTEKQVVMSLSDKTIRPKLPADIINVLDESQIESYYEFAAYYHLAKNARLQSTIDSLFERLLYLYVRDVSGDGGVNQCTQTIYCIAERIKTAKSKSQK